MPDIIEHSPIVKVFANNLRAYRKSKNMSQSDLARAAGIGKAYISDIERELRNPTIDSVERLAGALSVDAWQLLFSTKSKETNRPLYTDQNLLQDIHSKLFDSDTLSYGQFISDIGDYLNKNSSK